MLQGRSSAVLYPNPGSPFLAWGSAALSGCGGKIIQMGEDADPGAK